MSVYDPDNIFSKILRGEIPCDTVYEDDSVLAFKDINPQKKQHILVIPKAEYVSLDDFTEKASDGEIASLFRAVGKIARNLNIHESGYRVIANINRHGGQEVPHLHLHILGGEPVGPMVSG